MLRGIPGGCPIAALWIGCALLFGQSPPKEVAIRTHPYTPPSSILRAHASLVETGLVVRDASARPVGGLQASDFEVLDDGVPRPIVAFSEVRTASSTGSDAIAAGSGRPPAPPAAARLRYVTFFFDDLHLPSAGMLFVKQAARKFIAGGIAASDRLSIVTASGECDLDFTSDAQVFAAKLEHLSSHFREPILGYCGVNGTDSYIFLHAMDGQIIEQALNAAMNCVACSYNESPAQCRMKAYGVAHSEASSTWEQMLATSHDTLSALDYAAKRLAQANGTRVLVLTSYGFLLRPGVPPELQSFIDGALKRNVVVHAIGAQGLTAEMGGAKGLLRRSIYAAPLENIAEKTGGHFFKDTNDLAEAMHTAANPQVSYTLTFEAGSPDGKFHALKILSKGNGRELEYRSGYFSPEPDAALPARKRMDDAVLSGQNLGEIPVTVALSAGQPRNNEIPVSIRLTMDVNRLEFSSVKGRHVQHIAIVVALLDLAGGFVTGEESIMDLAVSKERLASLRLTGLTAVATLHAHPGRYQVRTIVREGMKGRLAAQSTAVEVRGQ